MDNDGSSHKEPRNSEYGPSCRREDIFASVGDQIEQLNKNGKAEDVGDDYEDEDQKLVEEIESLCMNCGENVCFYNDTNRDFQRS